VRAWCAVKKIGIRGGGRAEVTSRGWRGGMARAMENGRKRDKAAQRKRDLVHCKAGDDNRLTSALSSSGSSSSLETQLIFVIMPHPPPTALDRSSPLSSSSPPVPSPATGRAVSCSFVTFALLSKRTGFNEISCHRDICLLLSSFLFPLFLSLSLSLSLSCSYCASC